MKLNETCNDEDQVILKVQKSAISSIGSGVARIHESYLDCFDKDEIEMVELKAGKKQKVVKLVSDRLAKKGCVILRSGDMKDLGVEEGDEIELHPYQKFSEELREKWQNLRERLRRRGEEENEQEEK